MRSQKFVFALGFVLLAVVGLWLAGCSSDDPAPVNGGGDVTTINPEYQLVVAEVNMVLDSTMSLIGNGLDVFATTRQNDGTGAVEPGDLEFSSFDPDSILASNEWLVIYTTNLQTAYGGRHVDSLLLTRSGLPIGSASLADGMLIKQDWSQIYTQAADSYRNFVIEGSFTFSNLNTDLARINGHSDVEIINTVVTDDSTVTREYVISADLAGFVIDDQAGSWPSGCPSSGTCSAAVQLTYQKDDAAAVVTTWNLTMVFTDGSVDAAIADHRNDTTYTHSFCTVQ